MTEQSKVTVKHSGIALALASAQKAMGPALKGNVNPAFKSKYADLSSVMDACLPALNGEGIAVIQPTFDDESGRYVKTIFLHGESGETLECRVPLIVNKNDMQGYGSAVTYARRYGLMCMAGIAPEDDDGNAAAASAPREVRNAFDPKGAAGRISGKLNRCGTLDELREAWRAEADTLADIKKAAPDIYDELTRTKDARKTTLEANPPVTEDEIPY